MFIRRSTPDFDFMIVEWLIRSRKCKVDNASTMTRRWRQRTSRYDRHIRFSTFRLEWKAMPAFILWIKDKLHVRKQIHKYNYEGKKKFFVGFRRLKNTSWPQTMRLHYQFLRSLLYHIHKNPYSETFLSFTNPFLISFLRSFSERERMLKCTKMYQSNPTLFHYWFIYLSTNNSLKLNLTL